MMAHSVNPSSWEAEAGEFLSSRPAWSSEWDPGQPELLQINPVLKKIKKGRKRISPRSGILINFLYLQSPSEGSELRDSWYPLNTTFRLFLQLLLPHSEGYLPRPCALYSTWFGSGLRSKTITNYRTAILGTVWKGNPLYSRRNCESAYVLDFTYICLYSWIVSFSLPT